MRRKGSHTQYDIEYHIVWTTKYRYKILKGKVAERARELIRQGCEARGITIIRGAVGKEHIDILISCPPSLSPAQIVKYLKGRSSRLLQEEFKELRKRILGATLVGTRIFLWNSRNGNRGDNKRIYRKPKRRYR